MILLEHSRFLTLNDNPYLSMKISIIIPTFNSASVLNKCLESVINQTFQNWEVLLMDGASKDDTVQIVESFNDSRIRIFSEPDKGVYDAMNKGIDKAFGDWIYFLGSDDYLFNPHSLDSIVVCLDDSIDVVYGEVDSDLSEYHKGIWTLEKIQHNRCHQCVFYNKRFFSTGLRYNLQYPILADFDLNLHWILDENIKVKYTPVIVAHYCLGGLSSTINDEKFEADFGKLLINYNHGRLTSRYKKIAAKTVLNRNKLSIYGFILWKFRYYFYFLMQHTEQCLNIQQDKFND